MRIALTNPFSWPHIRRGSERLLHDLAAYLSTRGYDVTVYASHPGAQETYTERGVRHIRFPQRPAHEIGRWLTVPHVFAFQLKRALREERYDVVHALSYYGAFGAARALRNSTQSRLILHFVGIPVRSYFRSIPHDAAMFSYALKRAEHTVVISGFARDALKREYGRDGVLIHPPVATGRFAPKEAPSCDPPTVLFVGDVDQRRKGAGLLLRAWPEIKQSYPKARLLFSGHVSGQRRSELLRLTPEKLRDDVTFLGVGNVDDLPGLYCNATVTVLPAIWEAFGLVLVESLACGTPVVGCAHGGIPDIVSDQAIGRVFEPGSLHGESDNVTGLTRALLETIELARAPDTIHACHAHARRFDWTALGPHIEEVYLPR